MVERRSNSAGADAVGRYLGQVADHGLDAIVLERLERVRVPTQRDVQRAEQAMERRVVRSKPKRAVDRFDRVIDVRDRAKVGAVVSNASNESIETGTLSVEFDGVIACGPDFRSGATESIKLADPSDGPVLMYVERGHAWLPPIQYMSDPRLQGTLYNSFDGKTGLYEAATGTYLSLAEAGLFAPLLNGTDDGYGDILEFLAQLSLMSSVDSTPATETTTLCVPATAYVGICAVI